MTRMIQIRNVPDKLHREIKARAALAGMSLSDYLLREIEAIAARPTVADLKRRLAAYPTVDLQTAPVYAIREERDRD